MTDKEKEVKKAIERTKDAAATLATIAPSNETVVAAGVMAGLNAIANRPDESKNQEKSPEEKALKEIKEANTGTTNIAGLVAREEKAAKAIEAVDRAIEKNNQEKAKKEDKDNTKGKDKTLTPQKDGQQKKPEDKDKDKNEEKKKRSPKEQEEIMKKKFSHVELPSGLIIKAEGQSWNLYDKKGNYMDVTSQMNQLIAHNRGIDEANHAQDVKAGKVRVDENDLPIRDKELKGDMVESSVNKINTSDLKLEKDNFDLKKLDAPDMKKLAEIAVDRAFDENNLKLLRELEEKRKENENKKDKDKGGSGLTQAVLSAVKAQEAGPR